MNSKKQKAAEEMVQAMIVSPRADSNSPASKETQLARPNRPPRSKSLGQKPLFDQPAQWAQFQYQILMHLDKGAVEIGKAFDLAKSTIPDTLLLAALAIISKNADDLCGEIMEGRFAPVKGKSGKGRPA